MNMNSGNLRSQIEEVILEESDGNQADSAKQEYVEVIDVEQKKDYSNTVIQNNSTTMDPLISTSMRQENSGESFNMNNNRDSINDISKK